MARGADCARGARREFSGLLLPRRAMMRHGRHFVTGTFQGRRIMFASIRKRATFANICSFLALSIVLSMGTAYAAGTVRSKDIVNGQVKTVDLGNNSVTTGKIKDGEVRLGDVSAGAIDSTKI